MKVCTDCNQSLPFTEFHRKSSNKGGLDIRCKKCRAIRYNKSSLVRVAQVIYERQVGHSISRGHPLPSYTLDELLVWLKAQPQMQTIWDAWVASDYQTNLKPSVDRLDDSMPYSLGNIQLLTWQANHTKGAKAKKEGTLNANQRAVAAYLKDGTLHKTYHSIMDAVRDVNGNMWGVSSVANGVPVKQANGRSYMPKTYKGFVWKWL